MLEVTENYGAAGFASVQDIAFGTGPTVMSIVLMMKTS
jgi:hypothetical protein